ncbi:hypothetical protein J6590_081014 [Homalodisca vitripennis]|nr:hypothetical protein J6590_081014 [Homalodisca vitripennis]
MSAQKIICTVFWDWKGVLLIDFLPIGDNLTILLRVVLSPVLQLGLGTVCLPHLFLHMKCELGDQCFETDDEVKTVVVVTTFIGGNLLRRGYK